MIHLTKLEHIGYNIAVIGLGVASVGDVAPFFVMDKSQELVKLTQDAIHIISLLIEQCPPNHPDLPEFIHCLELKDWQLETLQTNPCPLTNDAYLELKPVLEAELGYWESVDVQ